MPLNFISQYHYPSFRSHYGYDLEAKDPEGQTVLMRACAEGNVPLVKALVGAGANVWAWDRGRTPLGHACLYGHVAVVAFLLNCSWVQAQQFVLHFQDRNILAHINSIPNTPTFGYYEMSSYPRMINVMLAALDHMPSSLLSEFGHQERAKVEWAFDQAISPAENQPGLLSSIRKGWLTFVPVQTFSPKCTASHRMYLVFYKSYMIICNGLEASSTMAAFLINVKLVSSAHMKLWLSGIDVKEEADFLTYDYLHLSSLQGKKNLMTRYIEAASPKPQKVENCTYASPKIALRAALVILNLKRNFSNDGMRRGIQISKLFSNHTRYFYLNFYSSRYFAHRDVDVYLVHKSAVKALKHWRKTPTVIFNDYPHNYPWAAFVMSILAK